jgi:hypothetical protein
VLFSAVEITRVATHGASLSGAEKEAATKRQHETIASVSPPSPQRPRGRGRPRKHPPEAVVAT